eukprot:gene954-1036_t
MQTKSSTSGQAINPLTSIQGGTSHGANRNVNGPNTGPDFMSLPDHVWTPNFDPQNSDDSEKANQPASISFLSPNAIRWINKRQPAMAGQAARARVMPARALQLREIFQGLDFDNSGSIDINELKLAIEYVSKGSTTGDGAVIKDPQKLMDFFVAMDANHDGTVDFNEFLIAMACQKDGEDADENTNRLRDAFFEFANQHRRQRIIDYVNDTQRSDIEKFQEMKELFKIQYFKEEQLDLSTAEKLLRAKQVVQKQMKEIHTKAFVEQKKQEQNRARQAVLFFQTDKAHNPANKFTSYPLSDPYPKELLYREVPENEKAINRAEKAIRGRFADFALHMEHTFTPEADVLIEAAHEKRRGKGQDESKSLRVRAMREATQTRKEKYQFTKLPPIAPPVSVRNRVVPSV